MKDIFQFIIITYFTDFGHLRFYDVDLNLYTNKDLHNLNYLSDGHSL